MIGEIKFTVNFQSSECEEYLVEDGFSLFVRTYHMHRGLFTVMIRPLLVHAMLEWIERKIRFANLDASGLHVTFSNNSRNFRRRASRWSS